MNQVLEMIAPYRKAIVPVIVGAGITLLSYVGVTAQMTVEEVLTLIVTAFLVYLIPNKK